MRNDDSRSWSRRDALGALVSSGAIFSVSPFAHASGSSDLQDVSDEDIFNFALNLESLETEYYLRGTTGHGMGAADGGKDPGPVTGGHVVPWRDTDLKSLLEEVAANELAHVRFYRRVLGAKAVSRPAIDLAGFAAAAKAAGLGNNFDPFASEMNFLLGGMLMEDVGVTAYHGAAPLLKDKSNLDAATGIMAVEAYHMGMARSLLYKMGKEARDAANKLSDARDSLDGPEDKDQGIDVGGKANFVPSDADAKVFSRTPQEVLRIVYLANKSGVSAGGLFPKGMNGRLNTT